MRHAIAIFVFCLSLPQAAFACMPMEGVSGTQNLVSTLSVILGLIYLLSTPVLMMKRRALQPEASAYARLSRHIGLSWKIGLALIVLPFAFTYDDLLVLSLLIIGFYALALAVVGAVKLISGILNILSVKNNNQTRRFAAAGDVK